MKIEQLQSVLTRAAALLTVGGGKKQAQSVTIVADLLGASGDTTVEEFVTNSQRALAQPRAEEISSVDLAQRLRSAGADPMAFEQVFGMLAPRTVSKTKVIEVARFYIGSQKSTWKSKPQALKAIRAKFDERVLMEQRSQANQGVTPW